MREFTYYLINILIFLPPLVLSFVTNVKPHKHIKGLLAGYIFVSLPFILWDYLAVKNGVWAISEQYTSGPVVFGLPLEEILFFITVPFAMIYVWGLVKKFIGDIELSGIIPLLILGLAAAGSFWSLINYWENDYTQVASIVSLVTVLVALLSRVTFTLRFWTFQALLIGLFLIFNSLLTMLPIITYNPTEIIGLKFGGIPIEDLMYAFAFINLFLFAFLRADHKRTPKTT